MEQNTFKDWMKNQYEKSELQDMVTHGVDGGFSGLIYYTETCALYDQYEDEIWQLIWDCAEESGMNCIEFIASFNGAKNVGGGDQFKNLLVWFAAEHYAYELTEGEEE